MHQDACLQLRQLVPLTATLLCLLVSLAAVLHAAAVLVPFSHAAAALQTPQERTQAEQALRPFGQSTEYVPHCKVRWCSRQQQAAEAGRDLQQPPRPQVKH